MPQVFLKFYRLGNLAGSPMTKSISVVDADGVADESARLKGLSSAEIERKLDDCPTPWTCPERCWIGCTGCVERARSESVCSDDDRAPPSPEELRRVVLLGRAVGLNVQVASLRDRPQVIRFTKTLELLNGRLNRSGRR